ncbi:MAG: translation initiation factor [Pseudomonadota bacterium]|jgi:translation initiation factor IF-2
MTVKIRVYELAKELSIDNKVAVTKLKSMGIEVGSHQSTLSAEEAERLRAAIRGGDSKPAATAAGAPRPTVVIRRRKADTPADAAPAEPEVTAPAATPAIPAEVHVEEPEPVEAPKQAEAPGIEARQPIAPAPTPAPAEPRVTAQEPAAEETTEAAPPAPSAKADSPETAATPRRTLQVAASATIIRRASPEEVAAANAAREQQAASTRARTMRREDSRGTRVTGMGLLHDRGGAQGQASGPEAAAGGAPETDAFGVRRRTTEGRERTREEQEEESARARAAKNRRANANLNVRALLTQAEEVEGEGEATEASEEVQPRVFTPTGPRTRRDAKRRKDLKRTQMTTPRAAYRVVEMGETIQIGELAKQMSVKAGEIIKKLMSQGMMLTINAEIDADTAGILAGDYGFEVKVKIATIDDILARSRDESVKAGHRPPIVTIMGHVDHGKTSILDAIREADVAGGEAGGITQHIGAYQVEKNGKRITFLDTPGHEAFSSMRARGASLTDIVILVVAADDGVMPQTVEAINHARAANVPVIVAINKIDKPNKNFDRINSELAEHGIQSEEWGGENQFVKVSALQKLGLDDLLEAILLQAEVLDLKAKTSGAATGAVVEAHLDKGRGPVATIMVREGIMKTGDYIVAGQKSGRVRAMSDHRGQQVKEAGPATPVQVIGLDGVPEAGDQVDVVADDRQAREAVAFRQEQARKAASVKSSAASIDDLLGKIQTADKYEVALIIKGDTQGSIEAVADAVLKLSTPRVANRIIHKAVGGITESDVTLATASKAIVLGFNVRAGRGLQEHAEKAGIVIKYFSIIYELVDAVKAIMAGKLPPVVKEVVLGHAKVRQPFNVPKIGVIGGSAVTDGKITRNSLVRLIRDDIVIYTGKIGSLRRFKDDVREVANGYECGIGIDGYQDLREGDVIEAYVLEETAATL